jgi:conjugative transfer signal peptidase TraF
MRPVLLSDQGVEQWRAARRRLNKRLQLGAAGLGLLGLTILCPPAPLLVWNASSSVPQGLYAVHQGVLPLRQDFVLAKLPEPWRGLAARRNYLPANVPLVKRVAAIGGDLVCASKHYVWINGAVAARRLRSDAYGRLLPWWEGCHRLRGREMFLLARDQASSFDGRYFGVTRPQDVVGTARLLWAR